MHLTNDQLEAAIFRVSREIIGLQLQVDDYKIFQKILFEEQDRRFKTGEMK